MNMLHECCATHVLLVVWDVELDGGIHFFIPPEERSRSDQITPNFKVQNFLSKHDYLVKFSISIQKNVVTFDVRQTLNPRQCRGGVGATPPPSSFSGLAAEPLGGSR